VAMTGMTPSYSNLLGVDIDLVNADGFLPNGATSASLTMKSAGDGYYPAVLTFATDLYQPVMSGSAFQKTVTDLNGGAVQPGDVLEYTLVMQNRGGDGATEVVARDTLPANATYVSGSLAVVTGANAGAKTDGAGDDQAEYVAASRSIVARLGTGANAATGGSIVPNVATSVRFRVTVNTPAPTGTVVANQSSLSYRGAQLGTQFTAMSDADTLTPGLQPTAVTVAPPLLSGSVFEDVNYGGGAGRTRAASAGVGRPNARVELYTSTGAYLGVATTDATGAFTFDGWGPGSYVVRVVSTTVTSSRPGAAAGQLAVQTFRTTASAGVATADAARVGGETPSFLEAASNTTSQSLASLTTASVMPQSIAPVTMGTTGVAGIDFGYNFDTIVNVNDSNLGSLRQFLVNANALGNTGLAQAGFTAGTENAVFMIGDGLAHPGLRAGLPNLLTAGVAVINVIGPLPALTDAATVIDGGTQTANVGDTNAGTLGAGGTAGVDAVALVALARPEVQLVDNGANAIGVDIQAADVKLAHLVVTGFGNAPASNADALVRVGATAARAVIDNCVLGTTPAAFADPGAAARAGGDGVRVLGADDGVVRNSLIGFTAGSGIALTAASDRWTVTSCEIRGVAIGNPARAGVAIEASGTETVQNSLVASNGGPGVDAATATGANTLLDVTIDGNGSGAGATAVTCGVRLGGAGSTVNRCIVRNSQGAGVMVASGGSANTITRNSISANGATTGQIGIDLLAAANDAAKGTAPFVTLNDNGDGDTGGNGLLNYPVLESAALVSGTFTLTGWARPGSVIEVFVSAPDPSGFGEGSTYLTTLTEGSAADLDATAGAYGGTVNGLAQGSDNTNRFRFSIAAPTGVAGGQRLTATATLLGATSEFSGLVTVVSTGVTVSGFVYRDADHDATRDAVEAGTGLAAWAKLVSSSAPGAAWAVASADPVTGAYAFPFVSAGSYTVVLDDNATVSDVTPTYPAGTIGTEGAGGVRSAVVAGADVPDQNFGLWLGATVTGRVFRDDGAGGSVANDGVAQAGEAALAGVRVRLASAACAGGACDSVLTDGAGAWRLWIPTAATGGAVQVVEVNPSGWISTGGFAGSTGGAFARAADAIAFTPAAGVAYANAAFGDVPPNTIAAPGTMAGPPAGVVAYAHQFVAGSAGSVTFSTVQTPSPALPGWSVELRRDLDCDGIYDAGEPVASGPVTVAAGDRVCLLLRNLLPAGAPTGAADQLHLAASMSYTNAAPVLVTVVALDDRTVVTDAGNLEIVKQVDRASARPGDVLTYTITYHNTGPEPLTSIQILDATPSWTVFSSAACGSLGTGLTGCGLAAAPSPGAAGAVRWQLAGALAPGASGTVSFQVVVQ